MSRLRSSPQQKIPCHPERSPALCLSRPATAGRARDAERDLLFVTSSRPRPAPQSHAPSQSPTAPPPSGPSQSPDTPPTLPTPETTPHPETKAPQSCFHPKALQTPPALSRPPAHAPYIS